MMSLLFPLCCSIITFFMSILHILLATGFPLGEYVLGGEHKVIPKNKRYVNVLFALLFLSLGWFYLAQSKLITFYIPPLVSRMVMIIYSLFLAYAVIGNTFLTKSRKEKLVMIPTSIVGFICSFITLINN